MIKPDLYIGIDPDVDKSGFAVWNGKAFDKLICLDLIDLCGVLRAYHNEYDIMIRLEAGWLAKGLNWHHGGNGSANAVGRNHEIGRQIEKHCIKHSIPYMLVKPLGYSSYKHELFCALTRWPLNKSTNPETRVAGMLVYGL